jgi:hypothetical protein
MGKPAITQTHQTGEGRYPGVVWVAKVCLIAISLRRADPGVRARFRRSITQRNLVQVSAYQNSGRGNLLVAWIDA